MSLFGSGNRTLREPTDAIQHSELLFWNFSSAPRYGARVCGFVVMVPDEGLRSNPSALPSVSSSSPGKAKFFDKGRSEESTEPATERRNQGNLNAAEVDNSPAQPRILFVPNVACCTGEPREHENKRNRSLNYYCLKRTTTTVGEEYRAVQAPPWTAMRLNNAAPCKT